MLRSQFLRTPSAILHLIPACHKGHYRMFTVECPATGEPAATIGLIRGKRGWRLDQDSLPR